MDGETLRSRVAQLVQRTRKAVRLYSSAERLTGGERGGAEQAQLTALQLEQWQQVNTELQRQLAAAVDHPNQKLLANEVVAVRDRFYHEWRNTEAEVHLKQGELLSAGEKGDFVRCAVLGRALVVLKAREQAAQAAHHELQELIDKARLDPRSAGSSMPQQMPLVDADPAIVLNQITQSQIENTTMSGAAPFLGSRAEEPGKQPVMAKVIPLRRQGR